MVLVSLKEDVNYTTNRPLKVHLSPLVVVVDFFQFFFVKFQSLISFI